MRKKFETASLILLPAVFGLLSGCSGVSETNIAKNGDTNQAVVVSNSNNSVNNSNAAGNAAVKTLDAPTPSNANAADKKNAAANQTTPQIGSGGGDLFLVVQIKNALATADSSYTNSVIVDCKEGSVVLTGKVANEAAKVKAAQIAQGVKGVKKVQNSLQVSP